MKVELHGCSLQTHSTCLTQSWMRSQVMEAKLNVSLALISCSCSAAVLITSVDRLAGAPGGKTVTYIYITYGANNVTWLPSFTTQLPSLAALRNNYFNMRMHAICIYNHSVHDRWLKLCLKSKWKEVFPIVTDFITKQGRMKFVRPLYKSVLMSLV